MRALKKENTEPENLAIGQVSKELRFLQRHSEYISEIDRILRELRLTLTLIRTVAKNSLHEEIGVTRHDMVIYFQGVFLNLVHQTKDRIVQLVHLITENEIPMKPTKEKDISVSQLLKNKKETLEKIGIYSEIADWDQDNSVGAIPVALRKRTDYHHRISSLRYNSDYLNLGFTEIASTPQFQESLSDYGKKRVEKMKQDSTKNLLSDAENKAEHTLKTIENNIETISGKLIKYFDIPVDQQEVANIVNENSQMDDSFKVKNFSSFHKIPEYHKKKLEQFISEVKNKFAEIIKTIYLVGSLGRDDYEETFSDINIYVVFEDAKYSRDNMELVLNAIPYGQELDLRMFNTTHFLAPTAKKYRFIVKADGLLLLGEDLLAQERLPNAGLLTSFILNEDIIDDLNRALKWIENNPEATPMAISKKSRKTAKRIIDFLYGIVMSNKPQYTSSRNERVAKMKEAHPENEETIDTIVGVSKYGVGEVESYKNLIEGFRHIAEKNIDKMSKVKKALEETV